MSFYYVLGTSFAFFLENFLLQQEAFTIYVTLWMKLSLRRTWDFLHFATDSVKVFSRKRRGLRMDFISTIYSS